MYIYSVLSHISIHVLYNVHVCVLDQCTCAGYPPVLGTTILEKRRYVLSNMDHLRVMLMAEPRGHTDMYGALLVDKESLGAEKGEEPDLAVLFMHNEGTHTHLFMIKHSCVYTLPSFHPFSFTFPPSLPTLPVSSSPPLHLFSFSPLPLSNRLQHHVWSCCSCSGPLCHRLQTR